LGANNTLGYFRRNYFRVLVCVLINTPNSSVMGFRDDWPKMLDGSDFDSQQLLILVRSGNGSFDGV